MKAIQYIYIKSQGGAEFWHSSALTRLTRMLPTLMRGSNGSRNSFGSLQNLRSSWSLRGAERRETPRNKWVSCWTRQFFTRKGRQTWMKTCIFSILKHFFLIEKFPSSFLLISFGSWTSMLTASQVLSHYNNSCVFFNVLVIHQNQLYLTFPERALM